MNREFANQSWLGFLAVFIWNFGGVSGVTRRLVYLWPGEITKPKMRRVFHSLYPGVITGEFQIEDCLDRMKWEGRVKIIGQNAEGHDLYQICEREPFYQPHHPRQLKFNLA